LGRAAEHGCSCFDCRGPGTASGVAAAQGTAIVAVAAAAAITDSRRLIVALSPYASDLTILNSCDCLEFFVFCGSPSSTHHRD
jgi:hypothetical protein